MSGQCARWQLEHALVGQWGRFVHSSGSRGAKKRLQRLDCLVSREPAQEQLRDFGIRGWVELHDGQERNELGTTLNPESYVFASPVTGRYVKVTVNRNARTTGPASPSSRSLGPTSLQVEPTQVEPTQVEPTQVEPTQVEPTQVEPTICRCRCGPLAFPRSPICRRESMARSRAIRLWSKMARTPPARGFRLESTEPPPTRSSSPRRPSAEW